MQYPVRITILRLLVHAWIWKACFETLTPRKPQNVFQLPNHPLVYIHIRWQSYTQFNQTRDVYKNVKPYLHVILNDRYNSLGITRDVHTNDQFCPNFSQIYFIAVAKKANKTEPKLFILFSKSAQELPICGYFMYQRRLMFKSTRTTCCAFKAMIVCDANSQPFHKNKGMLHSPMYWNVLNLPKH